MPKKNMTQIPIKSSFCDRLRIDIMRYYHKALADLASLWTIFYKERNIQLYVAILFIVISVCGVTSVILVSSSVVLDSKAFASEMIASNIISQLREEISQVTDSVETMVTYTVMTPNCTELKETWSNASESAIFFEPLVYQLEIAISAVTGTSRHVKYVYKYLYMRINIH